MHYILYSQSRLIFEIHDYSFSDLHGSGLGDVDHLKIAGTKG